MKSRPAQRPAARPQGPPAFSLHGSAEISPRETRVLTILALALAAAFAVALVFMIAGPHRIGDYMTETDFYGDYARGAAMIEHGRLLPSRYSVVGPVYEITLGLAGFVIRDLFVAAQLLSAAAMTAVLLLWFLLLRRRAGARVALIAALVMATNAHFFHYGYSATTDALAMALQAGALYLMLAATGPRALLAAGLLSGVAFLTRYNAIYLLPAGVIAALAGATGAGAAAAGSAGAAAPPRRLAPALQFAAAFAAPVVPWVLYSLAHGGAFSFQLHHNIAYEVFARSKGIPWDTYQRDLQPQFKTLWDVIRRDPPAVFGRMLFNVWDHLRLDASNVLGWPTAIAAIAGVALGARDGTLRRLWPGFAAGGLLFLTLVPTFHSERYSLALLPVYAALPAIAFGSPRFAFAVGGKARLWLKPALAAIPLGAALVHSVSTQAYVVSQLPTEVLECAETLRQLKRPGDRLIARKWHAAFHGGVEALAFPFADSLSDLARYAHEHGARWLYISWPEVETRPQFYYLLDTSGVVPGLTVRRATEPHPAVLYEIGPEFGRAPAWLANDTLLALHKVRARLMIEGNNVKLLLALARIEAARGRLGTARNAAARAVHFGPKDVEALTILGAIALEQGDGRVSLEVLQRAMALAPQDPAVGIELGLAYARQGQAAQAVALWKPLIDSADDPDIVLEMMRLFHASGDREAEQRAAAALQRLGGRP